MRGLRRRSSALGFSGIDDEEQVAMAVHDVTLDFARQMKGEQLQGSTPIAHRVQEPTKSRRSSFATPARRRA